MTSFSYGTKWPVYAKQWDAMEAIDDEWRATFKQLGEHAISNKARYVGVEIETGVPWMMIAAIHRRESDCDFDTYLGNGEPLDEVTTLVPAGRGPFDTWEEGAIDALTYDGLTEVPDWRLEKMIFYSEKYNGVGYHNKGLPSPYCWAGTTIHSPASMLPMESSIRMCGTSSPAAAVYCTPSTGSTRQHNTNAKRQYRRGYNHIRSVVK